MQLSDSEVQNRLSPLAGWQLIETDGVEAISKSYKQDGFLSGLAFVTRVAVLAEKANHHPDVLLTYPRVTLTLRTHDARGLTTGDFDLAAEIDAL